MKIRDLRDMSDVTILIPNTLKMRLSLGVRFLIFVT